MRIMALRLGMLVQSLNRSKLLSAFITFKLGSLIWLSFDSLGFKLLECSRGQLDHLSLQIVAMEIRFIVFFVQLQFVEAEQTGGATEIASGWVMDLHHQSIIKVLEILNKLCIIIMIVKALCTLYPRLETAKIGGIVFGMCQQGQNKNTPKNKIPQPLAQEIIKNEKDGQKLMSKNYDLELANFYKDILQQQRQRMDQNQRKIEQMLARERQRSDRKQQQIQDQLKQFLKSIQTLIGVGGLMGLVYYIFTLVNAGGDAFEKMKKYWNQGYSKYELVEKYSGNEEKLPKYYLEGNSIQQELSKIEYDGIIGLSYIVGIPGSGKTSALKKVINNLRAKIRRGDSNHWQKIYYVNLRVDDQNGRILLQKTKQRIDEMTSLLQAIFHRKQNYQNALIVIDDIQMLDRVLSEVETKEVLESILFKCQMESCKFVVVSSSSFSYYRAMSSLNFKKAAYVSQIQNLSASELDMAIQSRVRYQKQTNKILIPQLIIKYVHQYDSIKTIMNCINLVTNEYRMDKWKHSQVSEQKLLQKLQDNDSNKIWQMKIDMIKMLREKSHILGTKAIGHIIRCILELPKIVKLGHKFTIIDQVVSKFPQLRDQLDQISNVIDQLDRKNMLIFGHPRSKMQRKALEEVLKGIN